MDVKKTSDALHITHVFRASAENVFRHFIEPDKAVNWMAPGEMKCVELIIDAVEGGAFSVTMENTEGNQFCAKGKYHKIDPFSHLIYDWTWQDGESPLTKVDVSFEDTDTGCLMNFVHSGFASAAAIDSHEDGWRGCIDKLSAALESEI